MSRLAGPRVLISVCGPIRPLFTVFEEALGRHVGSEAAEIVTRDARFSSAVVSGWQPFVENGALVLEIAVTAIGRK